MSYRTSFVLVYIMYYDHISAYALGLYGCNYINWRRFKETKNLMKKTVQIYTVFAASLSSSFGSILNSTSAKAAKPHKSDTMNISQSAFVII